jgi:hypothetical protein
VCKVLFCPRCVDTTLFDAPSASPPSVGVCKRLPRTMTLLAKTGPPDASRGSRSGGSSRSRMTTTCTSTSTSPSPSTSPFDVPQPRRRVPHLFFSSPSHWPVPPPPPPHAAAADGTPSRLLHTQARPAPSAPPPPPPPPRRTYPRLRKAAKAPRGQLPRKRV